MVNRMEEEKNEKYAKYFALKEQVEAGNIPEDWEKIYQDITEKIKEILLDGKDKFEVTVKSTQELYEEKLCLGVGENCELTLMNKYLTERLIADGFKRASFKLEKVPEYYATEADYQAQRVKQAEYDRAAEEANDRARQKWMYDSFDGANAPVPSYIYPKLASLKKSGVKYRYEFIATGSLYGASESKKTGGTAKLLSVMGIITTVIGVILGALYYVYTQDVVGALAYGIGGWLFGVAISTVRSSILQIINFSKNSDAPSSEKSKNIALNIFIIFAWLAISVAVILVLNFLFPLLSIFPTE